MAFSNCHQCASPCQVSRCHHHHHHCNHHHHPCTVIIIIMILEHSPSYLLFAQCHLMCHLCLCSVASGASNSLFRQLAPISVVSALTESFSCLFCFLLLFSLVSLVHILQCSVQVCAILCNFVRFCAAHWNVEWTVQRCSSACAACCLGP